MHLPWRCVVLLFSVIAGCLVARANSGSIHADIIQKIDKEKERIARAYKSADERLFGLVDSVQAYIERLDVSDDYRRYLLQRLYVFLAGMNRYNTEVYLKNGTYLAVLSYYPVMIEWNLQEELLRNLKRYANFSIKAARLIPNDTVAEEFLTEYMIDHPDDIFRYTEEFEDRAFALQILEKALRLAPESAKRYYSTTNAVSELLSKSRDLYVRKSLEIFDRYGVRSRAYLLLDDIIQKGMSLEAADSLGNQPDKLFARLVKLAMSYESNVTFSIYRYMDIYSIDAMRKINSNAVQGRSIDSLIGYRTPEELFVILSYGFRETTPKTLNLLFGELKKKSSGMFISSPLLASLNKTKLKEFVIHADKNQMLDDLLLLVEDEKKDYLLALTTLEEREDLFPPFKSFTTENAAISTEQVDKALNEITKSKPPAAVLPDTVQEAGISEKIEKPVLETAKVEEPAPPSVMPKPTPAPPAPEPEPAPEPIEIRLDERTKKILSFKKNILLTLQNIPSFINTEYADEVLFYAAQREPDELLKKVEHFKNKRTALKILEVCALQAPVSVKRYLYNPRHPVNYILGYSQNENIIKLLNMNSQMGYHSKPFLLIDDLLSGKMTVPQAVEISKDPRHLFSALVQIVSRPSYKGAYSVHREMRDYSLRFIREINDKIASGATQPFYSTEGLNAAELYFLMLYGRDEVFHSTFNGLFRRFIAKLPEDNFERFLQSVSYNQFRDFLSLCAAYDVLDVLLAKVSASSQNDLLKRYVNGLENEADNLTSVVLLAEGISNIRHEATAVRLQQYIKAEYERVSAAGDYLGISIYGILGSIISPNVKTERAWYRKISKQFTVAPMNNMTNQSLFINGVCVEQMYFYNDDDGRSSYTNFINTYRSHSAWAIEDKYSYVRVYSTSGLPVEILANKPEYEENGVNAIYNYLQEKNYSPTVIVHRGHSFHTENTLERVPSTAKLVFVGSCGGFYKISIALSNSPDAQVISTRQIGTKSVNDPMLLALNENIRNGKDIVWNEFWEKMKEKLANNQYFSDYIPPNKNMEAIFMRAYYALLGV
ncbi:MAG: hypothetical protein NZM35_04610 [Chitinophagales bacterium]|nr:hypothetical protein [Chitinophagales bacterium]MDW8418818.1 hypothetical protein [Chitinophagales bacterium]